MSSQNQQFWVPYLVSKERPAGKQGKALFDQTVSGEAKIVMEERKTTRRYTWFKSDLYLCDYILNAKVADRVLHEICVPGAQKPRFDIDMSLKDIKNTFDDYIASRGILISTLEEMGQIIIDLLLDNIIGIFKQDKIEFKLKQNVIICSSNKADKQSYHLILDGLYHTGCQEGQGFLRESGQFQS